MDREILFRGFCEYEVEDETIINGKKVNGVWVMSDSICYDNPKILLGTSWGWLKIIPETLGQYTGLKDKNGERIFEGDIVKIKTGLIEFHAPIIYEDCSFRTKRFISGDFYDYLYFWYVNDCPIEVIGNIFKNPELLERK